MKLSLILLLVFLGLTGCIPPRMVSPSHHYDVYVDPAFESEQRQSIVNAVIEWEVDTEETVTFDIVNQKSSRNPLIVITASNKTFLHKHHHSTTVGYADFRGVDTNVFIDVDETPRDFHEIALHELGHALGLDHNDATGTIMYEWTNQASSFLTCSDMVSFCKEWGCNAIDFPLCHIGVRR